MSTWERIPNWSWYSMLSMSYINLTEINLPEAWNPASTDSPRLEVNKLRPFHPQRDGHTQVFLHASLIYLISFISFSLTLFLKYWDILNLTGTLRKSLHPASTLVVDMNSFSNIGCWRIPRNNHLTVLCLPTFSHLDTYAAHHINHW